MIVAGVRQRLRSLLLDVPGFKSNTANINFELLITRVNYVVIHTAAARELDV
jgi:hypothetical protein